MCDTKECCGTCKHGKYEKKNGYVCTKEQGEYEADYTERKFACDDYEDVHSI